MRIREATESDWAAIWPFFRSIVAAGETYSYPRDLDESGGRALWMPGPPALTVVAVDGDGTVLGSARLAPNHMGGGAHIANGSFMVDPGASRKGVGRALGEYALRRAAEEGYRGMQFNAVVETNQRAVELWKSLGFHVVGTVEEGFLHPEHGYVGLHIMYRRLVPAA